MKEEFLHYLWQYQLFAGSLLTVDGEEVSVISPGMHNRDSGPDFINSRVRIGETLWVGNVEMHLQSSMWFDHGHNQDAAYDNVVLHVVLNNDKPAVRSDGQVIPCVECNSLIPESVFEKYNSLMQSRLWMPCAKIIRFCPELIINSWIDRQAVESLEKKSESIESLFTSLNNDWEETFYLNLARSFGLLINVLPFEMLARSLPLKLLSRHHGSLLQIESMLQGQAGFLETDLVDQFPQRLKQEYLFLQAKYDLKPLDASLWKFMRLRPQSFPAVRIAQFAALVGNYTSMFSKILEIGNLDGLRGLLHVVPSAYWQDHYHFDKQSKVKIEKKVSDQTIELILINAVLPMLYFCGTYYNNDGFKSRALEFLGDIPAEENSIISKWNSIGLKSENALTTQALLHLKKHYCDKKRCLDCRIGNELLK